MSAAPETRNSDELLEAKTLADEWHVPETWIYAAARDGRLPHVKLGRYVRFRRSAVEEYLLEQERGARSVR